VKIKFVIPDALFGKVEALARRLGTSVDQLCAEALVEYLVRHGEEDEVTLRLDRVLEQVGGSGEDHRRWSRAVARELLSRVEW